MSFARRRRRCGEACSLATTSIGTVAVTLEETFVVTTRFVVTYFSEKASGRLFFFKKGVAFKAAKFTTKVTALHIRTTSATENVSRLHVTGLTATLKTNTKSPSASRAPASNIRYRTGTHVDERRYVRDLITRVHSVWNTTWLQSAPYEMKQNDKSLFGVSVCPRDIVKTPQYVRRTVGSGVGATGSGVGSTVDGSAVVGSAVIGAAVGSGVDPTGSDVAGAGVGSEVGSAIGSAVGSAAGFAVGSAAGTAVGSVVACRNTINDTQFCSDNEQLPQNSEWRRELSGKQKNDFRRNKWRCREDRERLLYDCNRSMKSFR